MWRTLCWTLAVQSPVAWDDEQTKCHPLLTHLHEEKRIEQILNLHPVVTCALVLRHPKLAALSLYGSFHLPP